MLNTTDRTSNRYGMQLLSVSERLHSGMQYTFKCMAWLPEAPKIQSENFIFESGNQALKGMLRP